MGHVAALYSVRVRGVGRGKKDEYHPLGDIDDQGAGLAVALHGYMNGLQAANEDATKSISCTSATIVGDDLRVILKHGQTGVAADIVDPAGRLRTRQRSTDNQLVKCGAVFRLPPNQTTGWLALHVNNRRGALTLLKDGITRPFRDDFSKRAIEIRAAVLDLAVREAVDQGRIDSIKLIRVERANDRANAATDKWVRRGSEAKLELDITARGHVYLLSERIRDYLNGDTQVLPEIIEFEGLTFDEAKVEVDIADVGRRTFNIEKPEAGHAITQDLDGLRYERDGDPTDASLFGALTAVLDDVTGPP